MGQKSINENKNMFWLRREELGLSREKASELIDGMTADRLYKLETGKLKLYPDDISAIAKAYDMPEFCNNYCAEVCSIGRKYVPRVEVNDLTRTTLQMLSSLNLVQQKKDRLIEIAADGMIEEDEIKDFVDIQIELENISIATEALQLWTEKMLAEGFIDEKAYLKEKNNRFR